MLSGLCPLPNIAPEAILLLRGWFGGAEFFWKVQYAGYHPSVWEAWGKCPPCV